MVAAWLSDPRQSVKSADSRSLEAGRLGTLVGDQAAQGAQFDWEAVDAQVVAPGAGRPQQPASGATQARVGRRRVIGVKDALEVAHLAAQRVVQPGDVAAAPLGELLPG